MWAFAWMFWLIPLLFFCMAARHRRRERWARQRWVEDDRDYVDSLERRVTDLEERLDFTERLLAGRNQVPSAPV
jgi:hypothetical protein